MLTGRERVALAVLGAAALLGLGVSLRPPVFPESGAPGMIVRAWDQALARARQVDVNTADAAELERLPQVGPALARRIVAEREAEGPFRSPQDLARVRGIGPKTVGALQDYVTVMREGD
jgi:competence protein ComEA